MNKFFKQSAKPGGDARKSSAEPEAHLAAFGKHPGWDDHIPGIGMETDLLAHIKQCLYVAGIGGQVDSGAWEKLEAGKRVPGFDHVFMGVFGPQIVLGCLSSSSDRLGRAKYPLVLCQELGGLPPAAAYRVGWPVLAALRERCQGLKTAEEVNVACGSAAADLRGACRQAVASGQNQGVPVAARQEFWASANLGPARSGFLRVLHELRLNKPGETGLQPGRVSRVPVPSAAGGAVPLVVWTEFLQCAVPAAEPVWLIQRAGAGWVDVIVGEVKGDEFFCLQASPLALPLATEVPYDLPADLMRQLEAVGEAFLNPSGRPVPVAAANPVGQPEKKSGRLPLIIGVFTVLGLALVWFVCQLTRSYSKPDDYQVEIGSAQKALQTNNYAEVIQQADLALGLKPGDETATKLKAEAQAQQALAAKLQTFQTALAAGQAALTATNYAEALKQAGLALESKPGDDSATKLQTAATAGQQAAVAAAQAAAEKKAKEAKYVAAMSAGQAALTATNYAEAVKQAGLALDSKPGDAPATQLQTAATAGQQAAQLAAQQAADKAQKYAAALSAGQAALTAKDFSEALKQAGLALDNKPGDDLAMQLQTAATAGQQAAQTVVAKEQSYAAAMSAGNTALAGKDFAEALKQAGVALENKPGDEAATLLQTAATAGQQAAQQAAQATAAKEQNYAAAMSAGQAALTAKDFAEALKQAGVALDNKPGDDQAMQLQTAATAGQQAAAAAAQTAAVKEQSYAAALSAGQAALAQKDFAEALRLAGLALASKPGDETAMQLQTAATAGQQAAAAAAQTAADNQHAFDSAKRDVQAAVDAGDYDRALSAANMALQINPNSKELLLVVSQIHRAQDLKAAQAAQKSGDTGTLQAICAKYPKDPQFASLLPVAPAPVANRESLDAETEVFMVRFSVMSPQDAKYDIARKTPVINGQLDLSDVRQYLKEVDELQANYDKGKWLTRDLKKKLDTIRAAITSGP